jgi:lysophospholipid acyltransferase (LPLAT)-like uncharacterized protein
MRSWLKRLRRRITYSEWFTDLAAGLATLVIVLYAKTLRIQWYHHPDFLKLNVNKLIYGFWHGRQFLLVPSFGRWHVVLMTDVSWAGDVQSKILSRLGYILVRGSSKRKGAQALLHMKRAIEGGFPGGIALDGPRGPIYESKPGILFLARKMGYPVIPLSTSADRCWILKSTWCRYLLPKPFSRCCIAIGKPIWQTDGEAVVPEVLDRAVMELTAEADLKVGRSPEKR